MTENSNDTKYHVPVLLTESIDGLITNPDGIYVDATFGGGGHSKEILSRLSGKGKLFAFDQDEEAFRNTIDDPRFTLIRSNYRFFENYLRFYKAFPVDGILADIGVSWHQFDRAERGFSIRFDAPLDMRMDRQGKLSAKDVLNQYDEKKLADVLYQYGELKNSRLLASRIIQWRTLQPVETIADLRAALKGILKPHTEKTMLVQIFQAIRIEVNDELEALKALLKSSTEMILPGGKLVIISYHSLEDRLVKNFLRAGNFEGVVEKDFYGNALAPFRPAGSKPVVPDEKEIAENSRSRSARMRTGTKL